MPLLSLELILPAVDTSGTTLTLESYSSISSVDRLQSCSCKGAFCLSRPRGLVSALLLRVVVSSLPAIIWFRWAGFSRICRTSRQMFGMISCQAMIGRVCVGLRQWHSSI
ncbi:hypothetical protein FOYG_10978 [Fusarium oxysporum NRRL 32931]|uniref:Uncharacterized protein n=1 Tax=Fusarium oxysporum NRRL 32931 TaxID=660029 RepID=W9I1U7_FUSOX|nr:hypothetical protein FOYG_10978 [Fusarium oxysporum NRRL 32931]